MANIAAPNGFMAVRHRNGNCLTNSAPYSITSAYATNIFIGDPVKRGTGRNIERADPGDPLLGVFAGCYYETADGRVIEWGYWPGGTAVKKAVAIIYDDPDIIYRVQSDSLAEAAVGQFCNFAVAAGDAVTGRSRATAAGGAAAATANVLRIIGLSNMPVPQDSGLNGMNAYGANAWVDVLINQHALNPA